VQRVTDTPTFRSGRKWTLARISCFLRLIDKLSYNIEADSAFAKARELGYTG
jgi:hypothetical protein